MEVSGVDSEDDNIVVATATAAGSTHGTQVPGAQMSGGGGNGMNVTAAGSGNEASGTDDADGGAVAGEAAANGQPVKEKQDEEEGDEDVELPPLLDWSHGNFDDCVCMYPEFADLLFEEFYEIFRDECDMTCDELEEYYDTLVDEGHHVFPLGWYESSYVRRPGGNRYICKAAVDYDKCTPRELKEFVRARGLPDPFPAGITLKYFYLRILNKADRDWTFRLMDLPPELRGMVFRELLSFPKDYVKMYDRRQTHPTILQACHQIHDEARSILYDENTFVVSFNVSQLHGGYLSKAVTIHNQHWHVYSADGRCYRTPHGMLDYPDLLRRIGRLELQLTYTLEGARPYLSDGYWPLNQFLYTFASFLMQGHRVTHFHIKFDFPDDVEAYGYRHVLYPLRRLGNIREVSFKGSAPPSVTKQLDRDLRSSEPVFNTMRLWGFLHDQASAQMDLLKQLTGPYCDCGDCPVPEPYETLGNLVSHIDKDKQESCFNSVLEEHFIARLNVLKRTLDTMNLTTLGKTMQRISDSRRDLEAHEAVSDEGRLEEAGKLWAGKLHDRHGYDDHGWSSDDEAETTNDTSIKSAADEHQLLDKGEIAAIMEEWEPDAASQLSHTSSSSVYEPEGSAPPSP